MADVAVDPISSATVKTEVESVRAVNTIRRRTPVATA